MGEKPQALFKILVFFFIPTFSFSQIKEEIAKIETSSKLVLVGETHNINFNESFQLELIKHLKNTNGLRYIILEHSYAGAFLYNKFLETGDTSLVCQDFYFNSTVARRKFWKDLYDLNKSYSTKLKLIGVDHDLSFPFVKAVNIILSEIVYRDEFLKRIKLKTDQFLGELSDPEKTNLVLYQQIKTSFNSFFESHSKEYLQEIFDIYYSDLALIYHNQHQNDRDRNTNRKFYENLKGVIEEKKINTQEHSFLGIFGAAHCASNKRSFSNITYYSESVFNKNVSTIMMHYVEVFKEGNKYYENTGLDFISKKSAKRIKDIKMKNDNFKLIKSSTILSRPNKYDHHFKYAFYIKTSYLQSQDKSNCN